MWFYIPAIILIVAFVLWFRRTNLYRHHRSGHGTDPGQAGYGVSGSRYEGGTGNHPGAGGGGFDAGGGG